jgi:hypothetical protein
MAMSGVVFADECVEAYNSLKTGDKKGTVRALVMRIGDDKASIVMEQEFKKNPSVSQEEEYNNILKTLPEDCGRFVVWDLDVETKSGQRTGKLFTMFW